MEFKEITLQPTKRKWNLLLLVCIVFTVGLALMLFSGDNGSIGEKIGLIIAIIFFGVIGIPFSWWQLRAITSGKVYLRLNESGLEVKALTRALKYSWHDIESFSVAPIKSTSMVFINLKSVPEGTPNDPTANTGPGMLHGRVGLPDNYGKSAADLAQLLTDYLEHYK
jgi:hypothetical protein